MSDNLPEKLLILEKKRWWELVKAAVAMVSSLLLLREGKQTQNKQQRLHYSKSKHG